MDIDRIEELRRHAKQSKSDRTRYHIEAESRLTQNLRNLVITLTSIALGIIQITDKCFSREFKIALFVSLIFGFLSLLISILSHGHQARLSSRLEQLYSNAFPTKEEYISSYREEFQIKNEESKSIWNYMWLFSMLLLTAQFLFALISLLLI